MNLRACSLAIFVALTSGVFACPDAAAQGAAQNDPFTDMARQRFQEGVKLYDAKKYEEARGAFLQAYALKKHPAVLLNLAQSELKSGHPVDAARHFSQYLQENRDASAAERKAAEQGLAEARLKTGRVLIEVNVQGADVFVDDELVGRAPLREAVDVGQGPHKIEARYAGYPHAAGQINAVVGQQSSITLKLDKGGSTAAVAPPVATPPPTAASPATASPAPSVPVTTEPPPTPESPPPASGDSGISVSTAGRPSFFSWATSDPVAWIGGGLTLIGIGVGIGFAASANSASSNADSIAGQIKAVASRDQVLADMGRQSNPCADPVAVTTTDYRNACNQLRDNLDTRDSHKTVATWGFIGAGVAVAGTVGAYFLRTSPKKEAAPTTSFVPILSPTMGGLSIGGSF